MQTEQDFWADFEVAYDNYAAARASAGFPLKKPERNAPLPSWVLRNGERAKINFVTRSTSVQTKSSTAQEPAKKNDVVNIAPATPLSKPVTGDKTKSKAEVVRDMIRVAMAAGKTLDDVIAQAKSELGMGNAQAKTYVTENWARVSKE